MTIRTRGRRLVSRLESLERFQAAEEPQEIHVIFGDGGWLGTVRLLRQGNQVLVTEPDEDAGRAPAARPDLERWTRFSRRLRSPRPLGDKASSHIARQTPSKAAVGHTRCPVPGPHPRPKTASEAETMSGGLLTERRSRDMRCRCFARGRARVNQGSIRQTNLSKNRCGPCPPYELLSLPGPLSAYPYFSRSRRAASTSFFNFVYTSSISTTAADPGAKPQSGFSVTRSGARCFKADSTRSTMSSTESSSPGWQLTQPRPISRFSGKRRNTDISPAPGAVNSIVMWSTLRRLS